MREGVPRLLHRSDLEMHPLFTKPKRGESYVDITHRAPGDYFIGWRRLGLVPPAPVKTGVSVFDSGLSGVERPLSEFAPVRVSRKSYNVIDPSKMYPIFHPFAL
jgi:hypothetical protein